MNYRRPIRSFSINKHDIEASTDDIEHELGGRGNDMAITRPTKYEVRNENKPLPPLPMPPRELKFQNLQ